MTYTEQAIKKAVEGGWKGLEFRDTVSIIDKDGGVYARVWGESKIGERHGTLLGSILLDPLFWQSLGKAEKWRQSHYFYRRQLKLKEDYWKYQMHQFIDVIISGKSAESYFESILK